MVTHSSSSIVSKGISANMLKMSSKRRRTQAQIKADKEEATKKEAQAAAQSFEIA